MLPQKILLFIHLYMSRSNCIESYQLQYQIYSSQQVRELNKLNILNWFWILYQWKISIVISDLLYILQPFNLNAGGRQSHFVAKEGKHSSPSIVNLSCA